jgi:hypothetical protein
MSTFFSSPYPKEESSIQERTLRVFSPNLKKLVLERHSSFYAYMNIDLATQVVIGHNFFLSSAWTGDDGQPRNIIMFPRKCTQQIFDNQIDQQLGWGRIAKHPGSSSPPYPQQGRVSLSENCPRYRTFLITPLSSTRKGVLVWDIGRSSSPPCPQSGRVSLSENFLRYRTFLITPLSSTRRGVLFR